jgi:hypothetical protein
LDCSDATIALIADPRRIGNPLRETPTKRSTAPAAKAADRSTPTSSFDDARWTARREVLTKSPALRVEALLPSWMLEAARTLSGGWTRPLY